MRRLRVAPNPDAGLLLLRLALGAILLFHGVFKLTHGVSWIQQPLAQLGLPGHIAYGAYVGEVVAPALVMAGVWTRVAPLAIALDMLMALLAIPAHPAPEIGSLDTPLRWLAGFAGRGRRM